MPTPATTNLASADQWRLTERARRTDDLHELCHLAAHPIPGVRAAAAENPLLADAVAADAADDGWLEARLGGDDNLSVSLAIAANPRAPGSLLASLAQHHNTAVRARVAANPSTPPAALGRLTNDIASIRAAVAGNWAAHDETIAPLVVCAARQGTDTARRRTARLWPDEVNDTIRLLLAGSDNLSDDELLAIAVTTAGLDGAPERDRSEQQGSPAADTGTTTGAVTP